jgi:FG-GAP-like repeat
MTFRSVLLGCLLVGSLVPGARAQQAECVRYWTPEGPSIDTELFGLIIRGSPLAVIVSKNGVFTGYVVTADGDVDVYVEGVKTRTISKGSAEVELNSPKNCGPGFVSFYRLGALGRTGPPRQKPQTSSPLQASPAGQSNLTVAVADLNGDGVADSAVLNSFGITITLFNADGTVLSTATIPVAGIGASILTADFNGDGLADLAVTEEDASGQGNVVVLLGKGNGTFGPPTKFPTGPIGSLFAVFYLATGDFNGDGHADLAVTNVPSAIGAAGAVAVLLGKGDGTFSSAVSYTVGEFP